MGRWNNFSIWKGRLPHWRADDVIYFVKFRHKRALTDEEVQILFASLSYTQLSYLDIHLLCVVPEESQILFAVRPKADGSQPELSDVIEKAKRKAGKRIMKKSGEQWPPFYGESFDRIIRDEVEFEEHWLSILGLSVDSGLVEEPEDWPALLVTSQSFH